MARSTRRRILSDDDSDNASSPRASSSRRRAARNVSYIEDNDMDFDSDGGLNGGTHDDGDGARNNGTGHEESLVEIKDEISEPSAPSDNDNENADENYDDNFSEDDDNLVSARKRRKRMPRQRVSGEDSDFKDDGGSDGAEDEDLSDEDDDAFLERLREKQFVATDDEGDEHGYTSRSQKRRRRHRNRARAQVEIPRRRLTRANNEDDDAGDEPEDDSIQQEIQDLYDSSPEGSPVKHKLREREKKVDYTIPSLLTNENENELYAQAHHHMPPPRPRNRKPLANKADFRRLLFPTAGPFGGSDVISVMGQNIPPGGIPIPGMTSGPNAAMVLGNDSDSSDDDFVPSASGQAAIDSAAFSKQPGLAAGAGEPTNTGVLNHTNIRGAETVGKKKNTLSDTDPLGVDMNIDFSAVGGLDNYIDQLKEMVALPLLYPELYQNFHITPPRGVLFHGPPGTGKTLMARALAASCSTPERKITFFMRKGADCLSKWVGEAERQLRLLFEEAKNQQPSIIFFDEIDGLAPVRSSKQEQIHASIVSTLLALMDGMDNRGQVIVIGATNRPDSVDPALRRPGRFDREFYFALPDLEARKSILKIHTKKWTPPLSPIFIEKIAGLTKGYGGADLRALCTEAALNSIQRKYPQIYQSSDKLQVNPSKVKVVAKDFMRAIDKIVPSSGRSSSTGSAPLPERLQPLLQEPLDSISEKLNDLLPGSFGSSKKLTNLEEAMYLDLTVNDEDGGFSKYESLKNLESSRICKPHLLICGEKGSGQQYLGAAVLNLLEGFQVQNLDLATIFSDVTRTPESCIVQTFVEAKRHQPSIIFISNIDTWYEVMPYSAKAVLSGLLRNLKSNEKVLLLGIADTPYENLDVELKSALGFSSSSNNVELHHPSPDARRRFFMTVKKALQMKPYEFLNDLENRPKRKLKELKAVPQAASNDTLSTKKQLKQQEYDDTKLKNVLKLKLAAIIDLFKNRYKRFKKPLIDDAFLHHLFDPTVLQNPIIPYEVHYVKSEDPKHENMIKELATGKYFYNMDLDTVEERIWNGYYSEAKQFLKDIRMIVKDSITSGDRERILKANEMLTNAQFGIDDFNTPEFVKACKGLRERELEKQKKLLEEYEKMKKEFEEKQRELLQNVTNGSSLSNGAHQPFITNGPTDASQATEESEHSAVSSGPTVVSSEPTSEVNVESTNSNGPVTDSVEAKAEPSSTDVVMADATVVADESDESEIEDGFTVETSRELQLPAIDQLFDHDMVSASSNFTVEKLEHFVAKLMEIVWEHRGSWDKTEAVDRLRQATQELE